jgi:hypothetical protein
MGPKAVDDGTYVHMNTSRSLTRLNYPTLRLTTVSWYLSAIGRDEAVPGKGDVLDLRLIALSVYSMRSIEIFRTCENIKYWLYPPRQKPRIRNTYLIHKLWQDNRPTIIPKAKLEFQTPLTIKQQIPSELRPIFLEVFICWIFSDSTEPIPTKENKLCKWDFISGRRTSDPNREFWLSLVLQSEARTYP